MTTTDAEVTEYLDLPRADYAEIDGPLCRCGHYSPEHRGSCDGQVGNDTCTCLGFRASRKAR